MNKIGTAKEIAQLTQYLLDEKSKWITGQIINIDGVLVVLKLIKWKKIFQFFGLEEI